MFREYKSHVLASLLLTVLPGLVTIYGKSITAPHGVQRLADLNLMQFMARTSALSQVNSTRSLGCFDHYIPVLNSITADYERNYDACLSRAETNRLLIEENIQPERKRIADSAESACNALASCSKISSSIPYFECNVNGGSENSKVLYALSSDSSVVLTEVREKYRLVENEEKRCTDASERTYVKDTSSTYEELQSCLAGKSPVPTTNTTATT